MKKNLKIVVGLIILVVVAFLYAHIDKMTCIYDKSIDSSKYVSTGVINTDKIEQIFISEEDIIDGMRIKCGVFGDARGVVLEYLLFDNVTGEKEAEGEIKADKVQNSKFFDFAFPQVENCKGKEYKLVVQAVGASPEKGIGFFRTIETENNTELLIAGEKLEGTLVSKVISHRFDLETFVILICFVAYIVIFMKFLYKLFR